MAGPTIQELMAIAGPPDTGGSSLSIDQLKEIAGPPEQGFLGSMWQGVKDTPHNIYEMGKGLVNFASDPMGTIEKDPLAAINTSGNIAAATSGATLGAEAGAFLAPWTFGFSIPIGAAIGGAGGLYAYKKGLQNAPEALNYIAGTPEERIAAGLEPVDVIPPVAKTTFAEDLPELGYNLGGGLATAVPLHLAGKGMEWAGSRGEKVERALDRKSVNLGQRDYSKTSNANQRVEMPDGDLKSLTEFAADDLLSKNKLGWTRDPSKLLKRAESKIGKLGDEVKSKVAAVDEVRAGEIIPKWDKTLKFLQSENMPANEVSKYLKKLIEYEDALKTEGDGSLSYLQGQKQSLNNKWKPGKEVGNKFWRTVYSDMQKTIEDHAPDVKALNKEAQKYIVVKPAFERALAAQATNEPVSGLVKLHRTTGGAGVPLLTGVATGHPGLGAAAAIAEWLAATPQGLAQLSNITGIAADVLKGFGAITPELAPLVTGIEQQQGAKPMDALPPNVFKLPAIVQPRSEGPQENKQEKKSSLKNTSIEQVDRDTLLDAIKHVESRGNSNAVSDKGARGPYQLMNATGSTLHKRLGLPGKYDPHDDDQARVLANALIDELAERFDGNVEKILTAYHSSPTAVEKGKLGPAGRKYFPSVEAVYQRLISEA